MSKSRTLEPKKLTVWIPPHSKGGLTFFITKSEDGKNRICKFANYNDALRLMTWANKRIDKNKFDFLKALEEAGMNAAKKANNNAGIDNEGDASSFTMVFSENILHRLIKKTPVISDKTKPQRKLKNLFGLLSTKDGYGLSDSDFSTDTSDSESELDLSRGLASVLKLPDKYIPAPRAERLTKNSAIKKQLGIAYTQEDLDIQAAIIASNKDDEKLILPKSRIVYVKPKTNLSYTIGPRIQYVNGQATIDEKEEYEEEEASSNLTTSNSRS